jgi:hypothetical protein
MTKMTGLVAAAVLFAGVAQAQTSETTTTTTTTEQTEGTTTSQGTATDTTASTTSAPSDATAGGPQQVIYVGPLSLVGGTIAWEYERAIGEKTSVAFGLPVSLPFGAGGVFGLQSFGINAMGAYRWYLTDRALRGLFVGPELNVGYSSVSIRVNNQSSTVAGLGFGVTGLVGYSFLTDSGIAISGGAGLNMNFSTAAAEAGVGLGPFFGPAVRLHIGYAF